MAYNVAVCTVGPLNSTKIGFGRTTKMAARPHSLIKPKREQASVLFSKQELSGFRSVFLGNPRKWRLIFGQENFSLNKIASATGERCEWKSRFKVVRNKIFEDFDH